MERLFGDGEREILARRLDEWLAATAAENPSVQALDRTGQLGGGVEDALRWYLRLGGVDKEITTIWFELGQRTLRYETYVMPYPEENHAALFEMLLRRNQHLVGAHYALGIEEAVFLRGEIGLGSLSAGELDRIVGTLFAEVERSFRSLLAIGFASRFAN